MEVSKIIKEAMEKTGIQNPRELSKKLGISLELLRLTLNSSHIPKDKTLAKIAEKLGINKSVLLLAAHRQRVPEEVKSFFLSPATAPNHKIKRVFPLSEEQCNYLHRILSDKEIQIIRMFRQLTEEQQTMVMGYIDYTFAKRTTEANRQLAAV